MAGLTWVPASLGQKNMWLRVKTYSCKVMKFGSHPRDQRKIAIFQIAIFKNISVTQYLK